MARKGDLDRTCRLSPKLINSLWNLRAKLRLERIERIDAGREFRFLDQHYRDAVAHWISQPAHFGDQEIALLFEPAARQRAAEDREQIGGDRIGSRRIHDGCGDTSCDN